MDTGAVACAFRLFKNCPFNRSHHDLMRVTTIVAAAIAILVISTSAKAGFLQDFGNTVAKGAKNTVRAVAKGGKDLERAVAKGGKDTERAVAKAARDVGLTSSLSDKAAKRIVSDAAKRPPAPDPTPPADTASPDKQAVFVQTFYL